MGKIGDFGQLLSDTFTGPMHYDSGPLDMSFDSYSGSALGVNLLGGRVRAVAGTIEVRLGVKHLGCDAEVARKLAAHLLAAADAIDAAVGVKGGAL